MKMNRQMKNVPANNKQNCFRINVSNLFNNRIRVCTKAAQRYGKVQSLVLAKVKFLRTNRSFWLYLRIARFSTEKGQKYAFPALLLYTFPHLLLYMFWLICYL